MPIKYRPWGDKRCANCGNQNLTKEGCHAGNTFLYFIGSTNSECQRWKPFNDNKATTEGKL